MRNNKLFKKALVSILCALLIVVAFVGVSLKRKDHIQTKRHTELSVKVSKDSKYAGTLKKVLAKDHFSGTAILVRNHKIVDSYSSGKKGAGNGSNSLTTSYEIDSLQKSLTAGLVMQQVKQGNLSLDDKVDNFIPGLPGASKITIRSLLDMSSGLRMKRLKFNGNYLTSKELLDVVLKKVHYIPNSKWSYQPVNYIILSEILEKVTDKPYSQLFKDAYIKKLRLHQSEMAYDEDKNSNRAAGYILKNDENGIEQKLQKPSKAMVISEMGTGQVYMSAPDFYKAISCLLDGTILGKRDASILYSPKYSNSPNYHSGLYYSKKPTYRYANGYGYGFEDHVRISPDGKQAVVVFSNHQYLNNGTLKKTIDMLSKKFLS